MKPLTFLLFILSFAITNLVKGQQSNNFEVDNQLPFAIDTANPSNIWEIATPSKVIFDASYSLPLSIITDSINNYPANNLSAFQFKINMSTLWSGYPFFMVLWHQKMEVDISNDGGVIEVSYDSLQTWTNIFADTVYQPLQIGSFSSDTLFNGEMGITEIDSIWKQIGFCWSSGVGTPVNEIYLRFTFCSDSIETLQEGWIMDNFEAYPTIVDNIKELLSPSSTIMKMELFPNPANDIIHFKYNKEDSEIHQIEILDLAGKLLAVLPFSKLEQNQIDASQLPQGTYIVLSRDENQNIVSFGKFIKATSKN